MDGAQNVRILVAVDGSDRAPHVLEVAIRYARATGSELVVLRVVGIPRRLPADALEVSPERVLEEVIESASAETRGLVSEGDARVRIESGTVVETILRVADEEDATLIVVGAHGYRFAERVLGTTAGRIVERAARSVLVAR